MLVFRLRLFSWFTWSFCWMGTTSLQSIYTTIWLPIIVSSIIYQSESVDNKKVSLLITLYDMILHQYQYLSKLWLRHVCAEFQRAPPQRKLGQRRTFDKARGGRQSWWSSQHPWRSEPGSYVWSFPSTSQKTTVFFLARTSSSIYPRPAKCLAISKLPWSVTLLSFSGWILVAKRFCRPIGFFFEGYSNWFLSPLSHGFNRQGSWQRWVRPGQDCPYCQSMASEKNLRLWLEWQFFLGVFVVHTNQKVYHELYLEEEDCHM